jgi:hypothetical protein
LNFPLVLPDGLKELAIQKTLLPGLQELVFKPSRLLNKDHL